MVEFDYDEWHKIYCDNKWVDLRKLLTSKDVLLIEKLGYKIKEEKYSDRELEVFIGEIVTDYYIDPKYPEETKPIKKLDNTGVTRTEYNKLIKKMNNIQEKVRNVTMKETYKKMYRKTRVLEVLIETILNQTKDIFPYKEIMDILDFNEAEMLNLKKEIKQIKNLTEKKEAIISLINKYNLY